MQLIESNEFQSLHYFLITSHQRSVFMLSPEEIPNIYRNDVPANLPCCFINIKVFSQYT